LGWKDLYLKKLSSAATTQPLLTREEKLGRLGSPVMLVSKNETVLWVILEDGGVISGGAYFKHYCSTPPPLEIFLLEEGIQEDNCQTREEDLIRNLLYSD